MRLIEKVMFVIIYESSYEIGNGNGSLAIYIYINCSNNIWSILECNLIFTFLLLVNFRIHKLAASRISIRFLIDSMSKADP
jgi:hypothetical protein